MRTHDPKTTVPISTPGKTALTCTKPEVGTTMHADTTQKPGLMSSSPLVLEGLAHTTRPHTHTSKSSIPSSTIGHVPDRILQRLHSERHQCTPATGTSDISWLLDPPYTSASRSPYQTMAYVDHFGDFHDSDYQDFPIVHTPKESRWESNYSAHIAPFDDEEDEQGEHDKFDSRHHWLSPYRTPTSTLPDEHPSQHRSSDILPGL